MLELDHWTDTLGPLVTRCQHIFSAHFYQVNIFHSHQDISMEIWHLMEPIFFSNYVYTHI